MIIKEDKFIDKYEYKPLATLKKEHDSKGVPTPTKIISYKDKGSAFLVSVLKNKNHKLHEIVKTSVVNGTNTHNILDKNTIDKTKYTQEQNELYQAIREEFESNLEPLIDEVWGKEKGLLIPKVYGGKFDSVGKIQGENMVWDYKKINKRKTKSQIKNYILQTVAYANAHNHQYNTNMDHVAIMTIYGKKAEDIGSDIFIINGKEFEKYCTEFDNKLKTYINNAK